jgi:hypothetical protein
MIKILKIHFLGVKGIFPTENDTQSDSGFRSSFVPPPPPPPTNRSVPKPPGPVPQPPGKVVDRLSKFVQSLRLNFPKVPVLSIDSIDPKLSPVPIWHQSFFVDLFLDPFKRNLIDKDPSEDQPALQRMKYAFHVVKIAFDKIGLIDHRNNDIKNVLHKVSKLVIDGLEICCNFPTNTKDPNLFYEFLVLVTKRVHSLNQNDSTIFPLFWNRNDNTQHGIFIIVTKTSDRLHNIYSLTVINTCNRDNGLDYHAVNIDTYDGSILRNVAMEFPNISDEKILDSSFW